MLRICSLIRRAHPANSTMPAVWVALLLVPAFLCLLALLPGGAAFAEIPDDSNPFIQPDTTAVPVIPDSLLGSDATILARWKLHPNYNSSVTVNRTSTDWSQGFQLNRTLNWLKLENNLTTSNQANSAQNNFRRRGGTGNLRASADLKGWGGLTSGVELNANRVFQGSDFDRVFTNNSGANLFLTSGALGALSRAALGLPENAFAWSVTGTAGVTSQTAVNMHRQAKGSDLVSSWDSTEASGSTRGLASELTMAAGTVLKLQAQGKLQNGQTNSSTDLWKTGRFQGYEILPSEKNSDRQKLFTVTTTWSPRPKTQLSVNTQVNRTYREFFSSQAQDREITNQTDDRVTIDARTAPFWGVEFEVNDKETRQSLGYHLTSNQNQSRRGTDVEGTIKFTTGPVLGLLRSIDSATEVEWENNHTSYGTTLPYQNHRIRVRQELRRPLSKKLALLGTSEESLGQWIYPDGSGDRDEHRVLLEGALGYRPADKVETRVTGQYQQAEMTSIASSKSAQSSNLNTYRIEASGSYDLTPEVKLSQNYSVSASYNFYRFNENNNTLVRTTEVRTGLTSNVGDKAKLNLEHQYRFQDNGKYVRAEDMKRYFDKQAQETYQVLTVTTRYDFTPEFNIHANQRMEVKRTRQSSGARKTTKKIEFTGGLNLNHQISPGFTVNATVDRTESYAEPKYWRIQAGVNRTF